MNSQQEFGAERQYFEKNGFCRLEHCIPIDLLKVIKKQINKLLEMACHELGINPDEHRRGDFTFDTSALLWKIVTTEPQFRNLLYQAIQRIPELHSCVTLPAIQTFTQSAGFKFPMLSELKVQLYLPWEKLFFQKYHQDINTLKSKRSVTFWLPLHDIDSDNAVLFKPGSQKLGPVVHEENIDEEYGVYHAALPDDQVQRFSETLRMESKEGDLIALDRLVFHSSPAFESQKKARWIILVRIDDMDGQGLSVADQSYLQYTPFTPQRYSEEIIPKVRAFLSRRPVIHWNAVEV